MILRPVRIAFLLGVAFCATAMAVHAQDADTPAPGDPAVGKAGPGPAAPGHVAPGGNVGPTYQTIPVQICVPETYTCQRTVYRRVCKNVVTTAYKCVCCPVQQMRKVTCYVRRPCWKNVCRTVYKRVPCWTTRTVMRPCYTYQNVTVWKTRRVDRGHYQCVQVPAHFKNFCNQLRYRMRSGGLFHRNNCCNPCNPCCNTCRPCPPPPCFRTVKRWCPCWVCERYPVTCCKKVCTMRPQTCRVCTYKCVPCKVNCRVCTYVCQPCTKTVCCTTYVTKRVPYRCCRQVWTCVPCKVNVTCCRMVRRTVHRRVPCCNPCPQTCCNPCPQTCCNPCCYSRRHRCGGLFGGGMFGGLFHRGGGCGSSCGFGGGCCH